MRSELKESNQGGLTGGQVACMIAAALLAYICAVPWYVAILCYLAGTFLGGYFRKAEPEPSSEPSQYPIAHWEGSELDR